MSRDRVDLLLKLRELSWEKDEWFVGLAVALEGVGPGDAAWQPPGGGNTIWQTLNHLAYYNERVLADVTGAELSPGLPDNDATFGEPGDPADASGWQALLERTRHVTEGLLRGIAELTDADLARPLGRGTLGGFLESWVMHDAHHTGQIVLIRKQQGTWPAKRD